MGSWVRALLQAEDMEKGIPPDHRKNVRKPVEMRAVVELRGTRNLALSGEPARTRVEVLLRDISPAGFRFVVPGRRTGGSPAAGMLQRGTPVRLELLIEPSRTPVSIVGTVAWVIEPERPDQPTAVGVRSMPELIDAATRRAFARWVAMSTLT